MELLSPSGNYASALSALNAGCDALYLGGKNFSARMNAENFSDEEMINIINYAHLLDKKVYVTMNTMIFQDEFLSAVKYAEFLYSHNVDALLIQDLGLAYYLHQVYPQLTLHASTQINCHSLEQAKALKEIGFKRIVVARESDLKLAKQIKSLGLEVEVFIHGALCVSYSGNCLLSSSIGGRSGNRGRCAQPCRLKYTLLKNNEELVSNYSISTKDLCTLPNIKELVNAGIDSLKIEGRLKQDEYVYLVTSIYRKAIDACLKKEKLNNEEDQKNLQKIFSREFTKGYIFSSSPFAVLNQKSSSHQGEKIGVVTKVKGDNVYIQLSQNVHRLDGIRFLSKTPYGRQIQTMYVDNQAVETASKGQIILIKHVKEKIEVSCEVILTSPYLLLSQCQTNSKIQKKYPLSGRIIAYKNKPLMFEIQGLNRVSNKSKTIIQPAINNPTSRQRIIEQFAKTNNLPLYYEKIEVLGDEDIFIPISEINNLRNQTLEKYLSSINTQKIIKKEKYQSKIIKENSKSSLKAICLKDEQMEICQKYHLEIFSHKNKNLENRIASIMEFPNENKIVHSFIQGKDLIASPYSNISNSYALDAYFSLGYKECILSSELDFPTIQLILEDYYHRHQIYPNVGMYIYGSYEMMVMKSCPIGTFYHNQKTNCNRCHQDQFYLKDQSNQSYALIGDYQCNIHVLDSKTLYLIDNIKQISNAHINNLYLNFTLEQPLRVREIIENVYLNLKQTKSLNYVNFTSGHFYKRVL